MSLKSVMAFTINTHLLQENGDTFYFPFTIMAKKLFPSRKIVRKVFKGK